MENIKKDELIDNFKYQLPILRAMLNLTQDEIGEIVGLSRQTYSAIETGKRRMTWSNFMSLLFFFYFNPETRNFVEHNELFPDQLKEILSINHRKMDA